MYYLYIIVYRCGIAAALVLLVVLLCSYIIYKKWWLWVVYILMLVTARALHFNPRVCVCLFLLLRL